MLYASDIERAIVEFEQAIGGMFADPLRRDIALLQSRISMAERLKKRTAVLRKELIELRRQQIEKELAA